MKGFRDIEHLRLAAPFAGGVLAFGVARAELVPPTFSALGHFRAKAIDDVRAKPIEYAGQGACADCHVDVVDLRAKARPRNTACESCHGPLATHAENPADVTPMLHDCAVNPRVGQVVALNIAAIVARRLQVFQAMWLRQTQRVVSQIDA